jgi:protein phosphatase
MEELLQVAKGYSKISSTSLILENSIFNDKYFRPTWKIIEVSNKGVTPGQRYGHTMVFNKPFLVVFGGNSGNRAENDVWLLNINKGPFQWQKY